MINVYSSIIPGIVSSLIAVALIEAYRLARQRFYHRALRRLLPIFKDQVTLICPALAPRQESYDLGLLTYYDAYALGFLLEAASRLRVRTEVVSSTLRSSEATPAIVCLGGPYSNRFTKSILSEFCPGFSAATDNDDDAFRCGTNTFRNLESNSHAFLVRLSAQTTRRSGDVLLLWGIEEIGTAAAAFYWMDRAKNIYRDYSHGDFFLSIKIDPRLGFRSLPQEHLDVSRDAFAQPVAAAYGSPDLPT